MKMLLVLRAEQIDLLDAAARAAACRAMRLGEVLQLGIGEAVAGDGVQRDVGVAELVIEERADARLRGSVLADVADLLARLVEGVGDRVSAHLRP